MSSGDVADVGEAVAANSTAAAAAAEAAAGTSTPVDASAPMDFTTAGDSSLFYDDGPGESLEDLVEGGGGLFDGDGAHSPLHPFSSPTLQAASMHQDLTEELSLDGDSHSPGGLLSPPSFALSTPSLMPAAALQSPTSAGLHASTLPHNSFTLPGNALVSSSRSSRPRDDDDDDLGDEEPEGVDGPQRKKQRRVSTHPPPAAAASSSAATAASSSAATAVAHSQDDEDDESESDEYSEESEEESDEDSEDERPHTSATTPRRHTSEPIDEPILLDDDEVPALEGPTDSSSLFGGFGGSEMESSHDDGATAESAHESVIDLTADEPTLGLFDSAPYMTSPPPVQSLTTAGAVAAANASAYPTNRPQSITASLFSNKLSLPSSQFNPYNDPKLGQFLPPAPPAAAASSMKVEPTEKPSKSVNLLDNSDDDAASDNKFGTVLCMVYGVKMCPGRAQPKEMVTLTRMRTGADPNAIRVDNIISQPCGVLSKDVAAALSPMIDEKIVRIEAKVGTLNETEMGLRVDIYGRSADRKSVEKHLRKFPLQYLSLHDPVAKKPVHTGLEGFLQSHGASASAASGQPTYVNEFGETVVGHAPMGQGISVREIESDLDSLFGNEIDLATMPLAETPACLRTSLHPYQRQGLAWMIQHESYRTMNVEGKGDLMMGWQKQIDATGALTYFNKLTKEVQAEAPALARGGLLADEMGLGKTLQVLALIAASLKQNVSADGASSSSANKFSLSLKSKQLNPKRTAPTLIVCPLSVITNWEQQVLHHFHPSQMLTYYVYHGPNRVRDVSQLRQYDIMITTYNILSQEYDLSCTALGLEESSESDSDDDAPFKALKKKVMKKKRANKKKIDAAQAVASAAAVAAFHNDDGESPAEPRRSGAPLFEIDFFRIILDEAHTIREKSTCQSRAARALRGERRWALSGTPLINKVDDAFALLNFIRVPPFSSYSMWQRIVLRPLKNRDPRGMERLQQIMSTVCLRRRKNEEINGKRILLLPEKTQRTRVLQLDGKEKALYDTLAESGRSQFNKLMKNGSVLSHYAFVLEILLRMRQACNHSMLVPQHYHARGFSDLTSNTNKKDEVMRLVSLLEDGLADECGICHKAVDDPVITECAHYFCKACMDTYTANPAYYNAIYQQQFQLPGQPTPPANPTLYCGQCRLQLDKSMIVSMRHKELLRLEQEQQQAAVLHAKGHVTLSPKLLALLEELQIVLNRSEKAVVFSQWTSFLNILQTCLNQASVKHVRLDGQMSAANRAKALKSFEDDDSVKVFLISLKAGGVGLNLTAANHVFMMDPWWNPSCEDQAMDRVHRLGQTKDVEIVRFICKDSVEEKIMELQDAKRQMTTTALTRASKSREDQQADRLQDLLHLFK